MENYYRFRNFVYNVLTVKLVTWLNQTLDVPPPPPPQRQHPLQ